jgi:hypothetical protein
MLDRPYDVLGQVEVDAKMGQEQEGLTELRAKAGAMDADALIDVQYQHGDGARATTHLEGIAIKYR